MNEDKESSEGIDKDLLTTKLYASIGKLNIYFVSLEMGLIDTISDLISSKNSNLTIRSLLGDSFVALLAKFKRLFLFQIKNDDNLLNEFLKIYGDLEKIRDKRNKYLHSIWVVDEDKNIVRFKFFTTVKNDTKIIDKEILSLSDIEKFTFEVAEARDRLSILKGKFIKLLQNKTGIDNENDKKETGKKENS